MFKEYIHWSDGLFLQPHHFQQMQNSIFDNSRALFRLCNFYHYGFIDCEIKEELLDDLRIGLRKFSAIMPNGVELSMPGNAVLKNCDIDVKSCLDKDNFLLYLALPVYNENEPNLNSKIEQNKLYSTKEYIVNDENTGNNEISLLKRVYNVKLSTDNKDENYIYLPVCRLFWISRNVNSPRIGIDKRYCPPFFVISSDCVLKEYLLELLHLIRKKINHIKEDLRSFGYSTERIIGDNLFNTMQLRLLNSYEPYISSTLQTDKISPFEMYLKLRSFLGELCALFPLSNKDEVLEYDHNNLMEVFSDLFTNIRSVLSMGGYLDYIQYDFTLNDDHYTSVFKLDDVKNSNEFYICINTSSNVDTVKLAVEQGDNFKLLAKSELENRTRGVKLKELRNPPRYLPAVRDGLFFKIIPNQAWDNICKEACAVIDLLPEMFADFKASLFFVYNKEEE